MKRREMEEDVRGRREAMRGRKAREEMGREEGEPAGRRQEGKRQTWQRKSEREKGEEVPSGDESERGG